MLARLQLLSGVVKSNPTDKTLESQMRSFKLEVFKTFAEHPQDRQSQEAARTFCEIDVLYTLGQQSIDDYKLAAQRLNNIYNNTLQTLGYSENYYQFQGIYLLLGQFYSEIELLPRAALDHPSINFVIQIEQALSIGNYSAVFQSQKNPPTGLENVFLNRIVNTIRDQTAISASAAYQQIKIKDAISLFHMNNVDDLRQYSKTNNYEWKFDEQFVYLDQIKNSQNPLNADALINNQLKYVHELDKII